MEPTHPDAKTYFRAGLSALRRHTGLVVGLYAFGLATSVAILLPLSHAFRRATESIVLPLDLAAMTAPQWWALLRTVGDALGVTILLALVLVPLHGLVRSVVLAGAASALRPGDFRGFWMGVGRYGLRGLGLALLFLVASAFAFVGVSLASLVLGFLFTGEVGVFWVQLVVVPTVLIASLAVLDLLHDYARAALVVEDADLGQAISRGTRFPFRHGTASRLYLIWFTLALGLWLLPFAFDSGMKTTDFFGIATLFVLQQAALFARTAATVGWVASSVRLYSDTLDRQRVWIADLDDPAPDVPETT